MSIHSLEQRKFILANNDRTPNLHEKAKRKADGGSLSFRVCCLSFIFVMFFAQTLAFALARVSVGTQGEDPNGSSIDPAISGDGRYVAYASKATNLVEGDTNGHQDIFVHDRKLGTTTRISIGINGGEANGAQLGTGVESIWALCCLCV